MPEPANLQEPNTPQEPAEPLAPIVDAEGKLVDNWRELLDEDIREEKCLDSVKNFKGAMKTLVHARRMIGADKMTIPKEDSDQSVWDEYYKIGGRPETALDYNLTRPDDFPAEYYNEELAVQAMELFHKIGLGQKQAEAIFEFHNANALSSLKAGEDQIISDRENAKAELHKKWGNAYEQRIHFGNIAVNAGCEGNEEFRARLTEKFGDDEDFVEFTSNLGCKFAESGTIKPSNIPTVGELDSKIKELMQTEAYQKAEHPDHKNMVQRVSRLFREKAAQAETG